MESKSCGLSKVMQPIGGPARKCAGGFSENVP